MMPHDTFSPHIIWNFDNKKLTDLLLQNILLQAQTHKLVLLRGFPALTKKTLLKYCETNAKLLHWESGPIMEMKPQVDPKNYLFTEGDVPLHWDGAFHVEPRFLFFHCIHAPSATGGGETIFTNTEKAWEHATHKQKQDWQNYQLQCSTDKLAHYGGTIVRKLVQTHPDTGKTIVRFAESVGEDYLNPVSVAIANKDSLDSSTILKELSAYLRQSAFIYEHQWQDGDYLIADNFSLLHGRNAFQKNSKRHLRRIQIL